MITSLWLYLCIKEEEVKVSDAVTLLLVTHLNVLVHLKRDENHNLVIPGASTQPRELLRVMTIMRQVTSTFNLFIIVCATLSTRSYYKKKSVEF